MQRESFDSGGGLGRSVQLALTVVSKDESGYGCGGTVTAYKVHDLDPVCDGASLWRMGSIVELDASHAWYLSSSSHSLLWSCDFVLRFEHAYFET